MQQNKCAKEEREMTILEKANEIVTQIAGFATVSITDIIGSLFMRVVLFFVDLLLGL